VEKIYDVRGMLATVAGYSTIIKVGHVDTNNVWFNATNRALIRACDFIGTDVYPYFQTSDDNSIGNALKLFNGVSKLKSSVSAAGGSASVWITETGGQIMERRRIMRWRVLRMRSNITRLLDARRSRV
jgi:glucan endo-1,3-beta-D-glucosidase